MHHSCDRGLQYVLIRYCARLAKACIAPSVTSADDRNQDALVETINGLYWVEIINRERLGIPS